MSDLAALEDALPPMATPKALSAVSGIPEGTLAYWRSVGIGPKFVKAGRAVLYPRDAVVAFMRKHLYRSAAEARDDRGDRDA